MAQRLPVGRQQQVHAGHLAHADREQRLGQLGDRDAPQRRELLRQRRPDRRQRPVAVHASSVSVRVPSGHAGDRPDEPLVAIVEIPKGSSNKYEYDEELGAIEADRLLFASLGYPTDYGFFQDTLAADGDPLDVMIVVSEPTFPGCRIEVKPVALFRMRDEKAEDNKILCVPFSPQLEPRRDARRPPDDAARRDLALLLDLQDARVEGRQGRRLVPPRGGAGVHRARPEALAGEARRLSRGPTGSSARPGCRAAGCPGARAASRGCRAGRPWSPA